MCRSLPGIQTVRGLQQCSSAQLTMKVACRFGWRGTEWNEVIGLTVLNDFTGMCGNGRIANEGLWDEHREIHTGDTLIHWQARVWINHQAHTNPWLGRIQVQRHIEPACTQSPRLTPISFKAILKPHTTHSHISNLTHTYTYTCPCPHIQLWPR